MRNLMFAAALAAGTATLTAIPAPAEAQSFSANRIISQFNYSTLRAVILEMGGTIEESPNDGWLIKFPNGTAATAVFTVCADETKSSCKGTNISARFGKPSDKTDAQIEALVVDYNRRWNAGKSYLTNDGRPVVQAYIIADGGITMENYRQQLSVYASMLQKMRETVYSDG